MIWFIMILCIFLATAFILVRVTGIYGSHAQQQAKLLESAKKDEVAN